MIPIIISLSLISISCLIIWRSSYGFELGADFLGRRLPAGIKGATINAIASSMPEFLTTIFFIFYLRDANGFSAGLGVSSGSALFNLLIIPAMAVLMLIHMKRKEKITLNKRVLLREGSVLLLSQLIFIIFLFNNNLNEYHGLVLLVVYLAYLGGLFLITKRTGKKEDPGFETPVPKRKLPWALRIFTLDISSSVLNGKAVTTKRAWTLLGISTLVMSAGTWLLVYGTHKFGEATKIPLIFVSVVLSAAATSVPDTILSMKDAKKGNYDDAISNALGSNIFDIAFALGLPILLYNLIIGESISMPEHIQDFTQEVWVFLLMATVIALVIMLWGKHFTRQKAWLLLGIYLLFFIFVGTQVNEDLDSIGDPIKNFLTMIADWIGNWLY